MENITAMDVLGNAVMSSVSLKMFIEKNVKSLKKKTFMLLGTVLMNQLSPWTLWDLTGFFCPSKKIQP